jgi:hypothetical protein
MIVMMRVYVRRNMYSFAICILQHAICIWRKNLRNMIFLLNPSDLEEMDLNGRLSSNT